MTATCVSNSLKPGLTLPKASELKTYVPGHPAPGMQEFLWSIVPTALAKNYCESNDCKDQITFTFEVGCGIPGDPGDTIVWNYDGTTGAALAASIICAINQSPTVNAQGYWSVSGNDIAFKGIHAGLNLKVSIAYDSSHFTVVRKSEIDATSPRIHFDHGTVAHTPNLSLSCGTSTGQGLSGRPTAIAPTQDPDSATATQSYAGIVVSNPYGTRGQASGVMPFYGDCNDCCPPPDNCVEIVCACCVEVDLAIEGEWPTNIPNKLFYRIAPGPGGNKLGYLSFTAGAGLIPWPHKFTAQRRNGQYLVATVH